MVRALSLIQIEERDPRTAGWHGQAKLARADVDFAPRASLPTWRLGHAASACPRLDEVAPRKHPAARRVGGKAVVEPRTSSSSLNKPRRTAAVTTHASSGSDCGRPKGMGRASLRSDCSARKLEAEPPAKDTSVLRAPPRLKDATKGAKEGSAVKKVVRSSSGSQVKLPSCSASRSKKLAEECTPKPVRSLRPMKLPQTLPADVGHVPTSAHAVEPKPIARFVGMDVGKKTELCEVRDQKVLARTEVGTEDGLKEQLGPGTPRARVVLEACRESWHLYDLLTEWGHEVWVVDTTRVKQLGIGHHRRKNDRIDAEKLARAAEMGRVPKAWILTHASQKLRHLLLLRRTLVDTRAQYVITTRSLLRSLGCPAPGCAACDFWRKLKSLQLHQDVREMIAPLAAILDELQPRIEQADQQLDEYCKPSPIIGLLSTVAGVGRIVSAVFMSVIDQPLRFHNAHQVQVLSRACAEREHLRPKEARSDHQARPTATRGRCWWRQAGAS